MEGRNQDYNCTGVVQTASQAKKGAQTRRLSPLDISGAPGEIRTPDLRIRSPALYPAELQAQIQRLITTNPQSLQSFSACRITCEFICEERGATRRKLSLRLLVFIPGGFV